MQSPQNIRELTFRSVILGGLITLLFTAANVYLGLKVGLTFRPRSRRPSSLWRCCVRGNSNILENNIVQTIASARARWPRSSSCSRPHHGRLVAGFPYWITVAVCAIGGTLA